MDTHYQIDNLDRQILSFLLKDARRAYTDIAKILKVSSGTIHQRINKMVEAGLIEGSKLTLNYKNLGFDVMAILGINLKGASNVKSVIKQLEKMDEVTEVFYTTGNYALMVKVQTRTISDFHKFLVEKLQSLDEVQSTESYICLDVPIDRERVP